MDNMHCLFFKIDTTSSSLYKDLSLILKELGLNHMDDFGLSSVKPSNVDFVFVHHNSIDQGIPKKPIANNKAILILNPDVEENFSTIQDLGYSDVLYTDWLDKRHLKNCIQKHLEFSNNKVQEFSNTISLEFIPSCFSIINKKFKKFNGVWCSIFSFFSNFFKNKRV